MSVHYFAFNSLFCGIYKQNIRNILPFCNTLTLFKMICQEMSLMSYFPNEFIKCGFYSNTEGIQLTLSSDNLRK